MARKTIAGLEMEIKEMEGSIAELGRRYDELEGEAENLKGTVNQLRDANRMTNDQREHAINARMISEKEIERLKGETNFALYTISSIMAEARRSHLAPREHKYGVNMAMAESYHRPQNLTEEDLKRALEMKAISQILSNIVGTCDTSIRKLTPPENIQLYKKEEPPF